MHRRVALVVLLVCVLGVRVADARGFLRTSGGAYSVVTDASGTTAYATNPSTLFVVDVPGRRLVRNYPLTEIDRIGDIDSSRNLLALYGFEGAALFDIAAARRRAGGAREDHALPERHGVHRRRRRPCTVVASPDRDRVAFGDQAHRAAHVIRTADNVILASYPVGFEPCQLFFWGPDRLVAVHAGFEVEGVADGNVAVVDLRNPFDVRLRRWRASTRGLRRARGTATCRPDEPTGRDPSRRAASPAAASCSSSDNSARRRVRETQTAHAIRGAPALPSAMRSTTRFAKVR